MVRGLVLGRAGSRFRVLTDHGEVEAALRGRLKQEGAAASGVHKVVTGDRVRLDAGADGVYGIAEAAPRDNVLARRVAGTRAARPIAANLDHVFVLTATVDPGPVPQLLDRLLVIAEVAHIPAAVVVTKIDLDAGEAIRRRMQRAGYPVFPLSNRTGEGLQPLLRALHQGVNLVTGPSGAGKSTLLNTLEPGLTLATSAVSEKARRGKHTTVSALMVPLRGGGYLVDTPGLSEVGLLDVAPEVLPSCFPEFRPYLAGCRFVDCRHLAEPDCAVRGAVKAGTIDVDRHASYAQLRLEAEADANDWS